jgi:hypothetical protein
MNGKMICPKCMGNGYVYAFNYDDRKKQAIDCIYCNNQGEVEINDQIIKELQDTKDEKEKRKNI